MFEKRKTNKNITNTEEQSTLAVMSGTILDREKKNYIINYI